MSEVNALWPLVTSWFLEACCSSASPRCIVRFLGKPVTCLGLHSQVVHFAHLCQAAEARRLDERLPENPPSDSEPGPLLALRKSKSPASLAKGFRVLQNCAPQCTVTCTATRSSASDEESCDRSTNSMWTCRILTEADHTDLKGQTQSFTPHPRRPALSQRGFVWQLFEIVRAAPRRCRAPGPPGQEESHRSRPKDRNTESNRSP